uniref:Uncharacterized protein n=1 Tax=Anopheles minimus TaxID=112268 RepID=A0A182W1J5_9DIPT
MDRATGWKEKLQKRWDIFYLKWQIYSMTYFLEPWEKCLYNPTESLIVVILFHSQYAQGD